MKANLPIDDKELADKLNAGIVNRPKGTSIEQAAKDMLPRLSDDEKAVLVATATDAMALNAKVLTQPDSKYRNG